MSEKYSSLDNYCDEARNNQKLNTYGDYYSTHPTYSPDEIDLGRQLDNEYVCPDEYEMGRIQDDKIYISMTDYQHEQLCNGERPDNISGFFTDSATVDYCCDENGYFDNGKYNEMAQIAPYRNSVNNYDDKLEYMSNKAYEVNYGSGDATYKPHMECLEIDRERLNEVYGTYDFNAAIGKCSSNDQFGQGGANQGYNPYIGEMIENGCLKHRPEESYTDPSLSNNSENGNLSYNSQVNGNDYENKMLSGYEKAGQQIDGIDPNRQSKNNDNKEQISSPTGNAEPLSISNDYYDGIGW